MNSASPVEHNFKVVILGEGCVGKTSIVLRYVEDKFPLKHLTTLQASFLTKKITVNGCQVQLNIWDTAGQERFHALGPIYYRSSNGAILVYDITDEDSFQKVKHWVKELKKMLGDDVIITIVGNKSDLEKDRKVMSSDAENYAQAVGTKHYHTSAKTNEGIEELFFDLTAMMIENNEKKKLNSSSSNANGSLRRTKTLMIEENDESPVRAQVSSNCCGAG